MEKKKTKLSYHTRGWLLELCDVGVVAFCLVFVFAVLPQHILALPASTPGPILDFMHVFAVLWPLCLAVPIIIAGVYAWKIFADIGREKAFTRINSRRLNGVALMALIEAVIVAIGAGTILITLGTLSPFIPLGCVGCLLFALIANALAHLTLHAAAIQEENDLTV